MIVLHVNEKDARRSSSQVTTVYMRMDRYRRHGKEAQTTLDKMIVISCGDLEKSWTWRCSDSEICETDHGQMKPVDARERDRVIA